MNIFPANQASVFNKLKVFGFVVVRQSNYADRVEFSSFFNKEMADSPNAVALFTVKLKSK